MEEERNVVDFPTEEPVENEEVATIVNDNTTSELETVGNAKEDYKLLLDLIKEMEQWEQFLYNSLKDSLDHAYGLNSDFIMKISLCSDAKIDEMTHDELVEFITPHLMKSRKQAEDFMNQSDEEIKKSLHLIKEKQMDIYHANQETEDIKKQSDEIMNEYLNYLYSDEVVSVRAKRMQKLEDMLKDETDEVKISKMRRMISSMQEADSLQFITKRLESMNEKEIDNVMEAFFKKNKGQYVIDRYMAKVPKFGFNEKLYHYFFNLEENFLPEEYHVFNNLFLFYYMRFVAHADPNNKTDKLFVQSLTSTLSRLVYHKFPETQGEKDFIEIIKKVDDYFRPHYDYFYENNTTRPGHPIREEASLKREMERKSAIIEKCKQLGIEGYDENMSANDLQKFFNEKIEEVIKAQEKEDKEKGKETVTKENEDGTVEIEPKFVDDTDVEEPKAEA